MFLEFRKHLVYFSIFFILMRHGEGRRILTVYSLNHPQHMPGIKHFVPNYSFIFYIRDLFSGAFREKAKG